jgi:hypothetical protein
MVMMFWMIVGAILVPLVYEFLRTKKFYDGVLIVAPGYMCWPACWMGRGALPYFVVVGGDPKGRKIGLVRGHFGLIVTPLWHE